MRFLGALRSTAGDPGQRDLKDPLRRAWDRLEVGPPGDDGAPFLDSQLLRPRFAVAVAGPDRVRALGDRFWHAVLAVQLAHEASLLHDDVIDEARERRGRSTTYHRRGIAAALIEGDQLLARAYLSAAHTRCEPYVLRFARAVERTVAGERAQGEAAGQPLGEETARRIARMKSGELFGCAVASSATLRNADEAEALAELGRDLGLLYQEVDDLLDFCPRAGTGKPPLADDARRLWTWPRAYLEPGASPRALFLRGREGVPARRALARLERSTSELLSRLQAELPHARELRSAVGQWLETAREAVAREIRESARAPVEIRFADAVPALPAPLDRVESQASQDPARILARHGRSFHFAARLLRVEARDSMTTLYGFCRLVDDAVDRAPDPAAGRHALDRLFRAASGAYAGQRDHGPIVERAMQELRESGLSFTLVERLFEGVAMDLEPIRFADLDALRGYTHRVAGVVGLWIAGLAGVRDPWALRLADEMGHAMQLTNIARDVGADLALGRIYLPEDLLQRHRLSEEALVRLAAGRRPVPTSFAALLEELMGWAEAGYGAAFQALPHLPPPYRRSMAVAAGVYRGIHREIRRNGYDTLRRRARTTTVRKGLLAAGALRRLAAAETRPTE